MRFAAPKDQSHCNPSADHPSACKLPITRTVSDSRYQIKRNPGLHCVEMVCTVGIFAPDLRVFAQYGAAPYLQQRLAR